MAKVWFGQACEGTHLGRRVGEEERIWRLAGVLPFIHGSTKACMSSVNLPCQVMGAEDKLYIMQLKIILLQCQVLANKKLRFFLEKNSITFLT